MPSIEAMSLNLACLGVDASEAKTMEVQTSSMMGARTLRKHGPLIQILSIFDIFIFDSLGSVHMVSPLKDQYLLQKPNKSVLAMSVIIDDSLPPHLQLQAGNGRG